MANKPEKSPKVILIEEHYASIRDTLTWNADRLNRLCAAAQLTYAELAALVRYPHWQLVRAAATNQFPPPVELHLTLIEQWVFRPLGQRQIFPNILSHD